MKTAEIRKTAVLGGGLIGSSWATNFLWKGFPVHIYDVSEEALKTARGQIRGNMEYLVSKGVLSADKMNVALSLVKYTTSIEEALKDVQFIQEAALEKYEVKQALLAEVDRYAQADVVVASSTSGLLSKGKNTSSETVQTACDFYKSIGKEPVVLQKEALGFIANRLAVALWREAVDLVMRGVCSVEDVDKAVCFGPGLRYALMGPNLTYHLGGGPQGIQGLIKHIGPSLELWWDDMAVWKNWPPGWAEIAQEGVLREIAHRVPEQGRTDEEIVRWRDDGLIEILKYLKKI
jgi:3-hydroxyacyl-CoA dehydrogenase